MSAPTSETKNCSPIPLWIAIAICLGATLLVGGAVIGVLHPAMLVGPNEQINGAVQVYADYFAARNLALALMLIAALCLGARTALNALLSFFALMQFMDAGLDCSEGRWTVVPGVLLIGVVLLFCSYRLSGYPFWRIGAWKATS